MGRLGAPLFAVLVAVAALSGLAGGYGERVFNANPQTSGSYYPVDVAGIILTNDRLAAQSFTPTAPFTLQNVTLYVQNVGSSQADSLNVTIRGDAAGSPTTNPPLAWSQRARGGLGWLDLPLTPQPVLAANTKYWIVARNGQSENNGYRWFHSNADLVLGEAKTNTGSGWTAPDDTDMVFVTYGVRLEPLMSVGLAVDRRSPGPGETFTYTAYMNNTGSRAARSVWANFTLAPQVAVVSDTSASLGGSLAGPSSWTFPQIQNGVNVFDVTVAVDPATPGGANLLGIVHLDYMDSAGTPQPSSTDSASVIVALKTKPMYLVHDGSVDLVDEMRAAAPTGSMLGDYDGDTSLGATISSSAWTWTLAPPFASPFRIRGAVSAELFLNAANPNDSAVVNVTLLDRRGVVVTPFAWAETALTVDGNPVDFESLPVDLGIVTHYLLGGNATELRITKVSGADLFLAYNTTDAPSRVVVGTDTYISIDELEVADNRGPALIFSGKDDVNVRVNVSDPLGSGEIAGVTIDVTDPSGTPIASGVAMTLVGTDSGSPSAWKRFAFLRSQPQVQGEYTFRVTAREGNGVETSSSGTFTVRYPMLALSVAQDSQSARRDGLVRFTLSFDNDGEGSGPAWINATVPPSLELVADTAASIGGGKTGTFNWTFPSVSPGSHEFDATLRVTDAAANGTVSLAFSLAFGDEKGYSWAGDAVVRDLEILVPPPQTQPTDPFFLAFLGAVLVGAPLAAYGVWRSRRPIIEEAFLLHRDGVLLYHISRSMGGEGEKDRDILGAMLTALQDFVKDSFKYGEKRDLNKVEFGDYRVLIERGKNIFLAVVMATQTGEPEVRRKVREVLNEVEKGYGEILAQFNGEMDPILGVRDIVKRLVRRT